MPNPISHKSDVEFEAGGKTYVIRLNIPAIIAAEKRSGKTFKEMSQDEGVGVLIELFHAGLHAHHPDTSREAAIEIVDTLGTFYATQICAMTAALAVNPTGEAKREGPLTMPPLEMLMAAAAAADGTGESSTDTGANSSPRPRTRSGSRRRASP